MVQEKIQLEGNLQFLKGFRQLERMNEYMERRGEEIKASLASGSWLELKGPTRSGQGG